MRCEDFEARLNDVLDERRPLSSAAELAEHVRQCGACREVARSYEAMLVGLSYEQLPPAPAWLTERVVTEAMVRTPVNRITIWRFQQRLPAFALAASILVAAGVVWWNYPRQQLPNKVVADANDRIAPAANQRPNERPTAPALKTPRVGPAAERISDKIAASGTDAPEADGTLGILPSADWAPAGAEWAQEVADGLQPVTRPTVGAINGFLNLWGIAEEGHRS